MEKGGYTYVSLRSYAGKHGFCYADGDDLRFENGYMPLTVGNQWPASYYLIVAE